MQPNRTTPFTYLKRISGPACRASLQEIGAPTCHWTADFTRCEVKGVTITIALLHYFFVYLMEKATGLLGELSGPVNGVDAEFLSRFGSDRSDTTPGGAFYFPKSNDPLVAQKTAEVQEHRKQTIRILASNETYGHYDSSRHFHPNYHSLEQWMKKAWELNRLILVLMHIAGGQPARATELLGLVYCNGAGLPASFFVTNGLATWVLTWIKVQFYFITNAECLNVPTLTS